MRPAETFGLFVPGDSVLHRAPAGLKLAGLAVPVTAASVLLGGWGVVLLAIVVVAGFLVGGLGWRRLGGRLWALRGVIAITALPQLLLLPWQVAAITTARLVLVVLLLDLVTLTTRTTDLLGALEAGLRPVARIGLDPARIGLVLALTIRTVPVLAGLAAEVRNAHRARGRGGLRTFLVPLLVGALRHADALADALAARGFDD